MSKKLRQFSPLPSNGEARYFRYFTLLELLTVLVIITILAAILLPVLSKAKDIGRRITCENNLKQLGIACQMYIGDNDDWALIAGAWNGVKWFGTIKDNYINNTNLFNCPTNQENGFTWWKIAYGYNYRTFGVNWATAQKASRISSFKYNSTLIVIADSAPVSKQSGDSSALIQYGIPYPYTSLNWYVADMRHISLTANCLIFDGHVETIKYPEITNSNHWKPLQSGGQLTE